MRYMSFENHILVLATMLIAMFFFFSFFSVPNVQVAEIVDITDERIIELEKIIKKKDFEIGVLKLLQPPDYSSSINLVGMFVAFAIILSIFIYTNHKETIKKMELANSIEGDK